MSRATERYLRQATRGLAGAARADVRAELSSHIHERLQHHLLAGLQGEEAERRVLAELGAPMAINRGFLQVHTLPWLAPLSLLGMLGVTVILSLPHSLAEVQGPDTSIPIRSLQYVEITSLKAELQREGVRVEGPENRWTLTFPGGMRSVTLQPRTSNALLPNLYSLSQNGKTYLDANLVIGAAVQAGLPIRLDGWKNPQLHLGTVTLHLGTPAAPTDAYNIYAQFIGQFAVSVLGKRPTTVNVGNLRWTPLGIRSRYHIGPYGHPGEIYALVTVEIVRGNSTFNFDVAPVDDTGNLTFLLPYGLGRLEVVTSLQAFQAQRARKGDQGTPAVLLRLNNDTRSGAEYVIQEVHRTLQNLEE